MKIDYLKSILQYKFDEDHDNPWIWLKDRGPNKVKGQKAGHLRSTDGRRVIAINKKLYSSSRLAWFYMTGEWPLKEIDHEDTNPSNDRWRNLRLATSGENKCNMKRPNKGVSYHKPSGKYRVRVRLNGKEKSFGYYDTENEAKNVRDKYAKELHGDFFRS